MTITYFKSQRLYLLLDEIYHLIKLPFDWLTDDVMFVRLLDDLILGFCYSNLTRETDEFKVTSTITFVLQTNRLTKYASHPKIIEHELRSLLASYKYHKHHILSSQSASNYYEEVKFLINYLV